MGWTAQAENTGIQAEKHPPGPPFEPRNPPDTTRRPERPEHPRARLADLAEAIERIESRTHWRPRTDRHPRVPTGWAPVDETLRGGLARGAIHEWLGLASPTNDPGARPSTRPRRWLPPLGVLAHLARQGLRVGDDENAHAWILWIGRRCWPYPRVLTDRAARDRSLLERSIFIDARSAGERAWAADLALRCPAVGVVVLDARALEMAETRRLRLAAAAGGALALLARPPSDRRALTAASSRWMIAPTPPDPSASSHPNVDLTDSPRWSVELLRCKGVQPATSARRWVVRRDHETGSVCLAPESADRPRQATGPAPRRIA